MEDIIKYIEDSDKENIEMGIKLLNGSGKTPKNLIKLLNLDIIKFHQNYYEKLSEEKKRVIRSYQTSYFPIKNEFNLMYLKYDQKQELSKLLNNFDNSKVKKFVIDMKKEFNKDRKLLKNIIKNAPKFEHSFYLFRGVRHNNNYKKLKKYKVGDIYQMKDFESFSLNPLVSIQFLGDDFCCLLRLKIGNPEIINGLCLHEIGKSYNHEAEVLLIKQKLVVSKIWKLEHPTDYDYFNIKVIDLEIV